jgi:DNA modification methylase
MSGHLQVGDALTVLKTLPDNSVDMVLTSPPYYRLRDYAVTGQIGMEATAEGWVSNLRAVARETQRVITPTGSFWLNLGDTFAMHSREGAGRKSLLLAPERLALALIADGWLLRNKIVWRKANPVPTSVRDRLNCTWEVIYVFTKSPTYFFDLDAIREPHTSTPSKRHRTTQAVRGREAWRGPNSATATGLAALKAAGLVGHPLGRNPGDVWIIASSNYRGCHHATFPLTLARRAITAGCPESRCSICHAPWRRLLIRAADGTASRRPLGTTCDCAAPREPGLVLDPFMGSGTTAVAAEALGRNWLGIELNTAFAREAEQRLSNTDPPATGRAA